MNTSGFWEVSKDRYDTSGENKYIYNPTEKNTILPPVKGWQYWNGHDWQEDSDMNVQPMYS